MNTEINDRLDLLISLTARDCGNDDVDRFNSMDTSDVKLDRSFYLKRRKIINKHKYSAKIVTVKKVLLRVAVALMALMALGFLTIMATPDLREAVFEAVIGWYDDHISIRYEPADTYPEETDIPETSQNDIPETSSETETTEAEETTAPELFVPPTRIEKVMKPTNLPAEWEEEELLNNKTMVAIEYYIGDELYLTYNQIVFQENQKLFDSETAVIHDTLINDNAANIIEYTDKELTVVVWTDGMYYFHVQSNILNAEELVLIASGVQ